MNKAEQLQILFDQMRIQLMPHVRFGNVVCGVGNTDAPVVFVGEAPGRFEAEQGIPFVGTAGKNLDALFTDCGFSRGALYLTNAVKFRPVRSGARPGTFTNRPPTAAEIALCRPLLLQELQIVGAPIVATLGNTPLRALLGRKAPPLCQVHGNLLAIEGMPFSIFALHHPASVLYNPSLTDVLHCDMQALRRLIV